MKRSMVEKGFAYLLLFAVGIVMVYPLLWMVAASFRNNTEIFTSRSLIPSSWNFTSYSRGWFMTGQYTYTNFFINTFWMVVPTVIFTIASSFVVAYGFARFRFPFKKICFILMISSLMLPTEVIMIPRFLLFNKFGWINTYMPFQIPALFAVYSFFIFMLIQFIRGIPKELDESAIVDGCSPFGIMLRIILPLSQTALFSAGILQFVWRWNDFLNPLLYISSVRRYPLALGLRMTIDATDAVYWNQIMAMCVLSLLPPLLLFFFAQKHFMEGIATTGMKG